MSPTNSEISVTRASAQPGLPRHVALRWAQRLKRVFGIEIESCARCGARRVALDDLGAGEDEGFEGHLVQPGRVDRLIQGPWLLVQRVGATLASSRPRPQGRLKVLFAPAFDHCIR